MCILPEISAHHLQLKCMGGHFFRCHPYIESTTVLSDNQVVKEPLTNRPMIDEDDEYMYYYPVYTPDQPTLPTPRRSTRNRHP